MFSSVKTPLREPFREDLVGGCLSSSALLRSPVTFLTRTLLSGCAGVFRRLDSRSKDRTIPMAARVLTSAVPPDEKKGRGTPRTGSKPRTTAILTAASPMIHAVTAAVAIRANRSVVVPIILSNTTARTAKRNSTRTVPMRPSSLPMTAKMKSVSAAGSQPHLDFEFPRPTPKTPPEASAY